jgi:hypothetical protein
MSDSDLSSPAPTPTPDNDHLEQCLQRVARHLLKSEDELTVNKTRVAVEKELGLSENFFKNHATWKARSKEIVQAVVEEDAEEEVPRKSAEPPRKRKSDEPPPRKTSSKKARKDDSDRESKKPSGHDDSDDGGEHSGDSHPPPVTKGPAKKRAPVKRKSAAKSTSDGEEEHSPAKAKRKAPVKRKSVPKPVEDSEESELEPEKPARAASVDKTSVAQEESELSDPPQDVEVASKSNGAEPAVPEDDESDMSVLIDEPPKKRRGKKGTSEAKSKTTKTAKSSKTKSTAKQLSPDDEEIKRLQGWLVKCGIRKVWGKELKPYDTSKAKIKHLKSMLESAGMTGRYSNEKAKQIKEQREFQAELDAVKEFGGRWGQDKDAESGDESEATKAGQTSDAEAQPKRRLPKGLVDFGDSGDESD